MPVPALAAALLALALAACGTAQIETSNASSDGVVVRYLGADNAAANQAAANHCAQYRKAWRLERTIEQTDNTRLNVYRCHT